MREITDGIKRLASLRRRGARRRGQGAPGAARRRPGGRRARLAAGAALLRRRHRHPGRRRADDAARRRGQLRRLRDLQERGPGAPGAGDRRGDHPLQRPRAGRRRPRWSSARRCPASRSRRWPPTAACCRTAVLERAAAAGRRPRGPGRLRGPPPDAARRSAPRRARSARPTSLEGLDGLVIPGGESTTIAMGMERDGLDERDPRLHAAGRPILGTCAGMIVCDARPPRAGRRPLPAQRLRPPAAELRGGPGVEGLGEEPLRAVFIRAPWVEEHGPEVEVLAESDGHPVAVRDGNVLAVAFHPELTDDSRLHAAVHGDVHRRAVRRARASLGCRAMRDPRVTNLAQILVGTRPR